MKKRYSIQLVLSAAALCALATTFIAQTPAVPGQIPIPQPCTPELIAAEKAAAKIEKLRAQLDAAQAKTDMFTAEGGVAPEVLRQNDFAKSFVCRLCSEFNFADNLANSTRIGSHRPVTRRKRQPVLNLTACFCRVENALGCVSGEPLDIT